MHLMLRYGKGLVDGGEEIADTLMRLPSHPEDMPWRLLPEVLCQDLDILMLFDEDLDGIEDPEADQNRNLGMGDYRPEAWFEPFLDFPLRDGARPFRR